MNQRSEKDRISAILFIVVFLLVVVIVIMVLKMLDDKRAEAPVEEVIPNTQSYQPPMETPNVVPTDAPPITIIPYKPVESLPTAAPTQAPAPAQTQAPAPAQTQAPAPAQTQAPAPAQTQAPAQDPAFVPKDLGSGFFSSDTPTSLNIRADWSAKTVSSTQVEVTVTVYCLHQTLYTGEYNPVNFVVDGQFFSVYGKKISSDSYDFTTSLLATQTFTIDLSQGSSKTFVIGVEWEFGGSYSGIQLDTIACGGNVTLSR